MCQSGYLVKIGDTKQTLTRSLEIRSRTSHVVKQIVGKERNRCRSPVGKPWSQSTQAFWETTDTEEIADGTERHGALFTSIDGSSSQEDETCHQIPGPLWKLNVA